MFPYERSNVPLETLYRSENCNPYVLRFSVSVFLRYSYLGRKYETLFPTANYCASGM